MKENGGGDQCAAVQPRAQMLHLLQCRQNIRLEGELASERWEHSGGLDAGTRPRDHVVGCWLTVPEIGLSDIDTAISTVLPYPSLQGTKSYDMCTKSWQSCD